MTPTENRRPNLTEPMAPAEAEFVTPIEPVVSHEPDREFEFTDAHRLAANQQIVRGKVVVIDRGPTEPKAAAKWREVHKEPVAIAMNQIDATHAVQADPERYIQVPRGVRAPVTLEERVAHIERRLGPETPEEIEHRNKRDADRREEIEARNWK